MHIVIFATGGTIDKVYFDAKSEFEVGSPQVLGVLEEAHVNFTYDVRSLMRKDSLDITSEDRAAIVAAVEAEPCEHIVITHGTDTMAETGRALKAVSNKTTVLTGSMEPAKFRVTDAVFNIGCAVTAAQTLPHGCYLAVNGRIYDPERVVKNREALRFEES